MRRILPPLVLLVGFSLSLTACNRDDTYSRPYTWHPTHANDANIAAEVADPSDLVVGRGSDSVPAAMVVPPITAMTGSAATGGGTSGTTGGLGALAAAAGSSGASK
ncbi:MAG: hypothetical protein ACP5NP_16695 [Acetobacteraceae bacterium]